MAAPTIALITYLPSSPIDRAPCSAHVNDATFASGDGSLPHECQFYWRVEAESGSSFDAMPTIYKQIDDPLATFVAGQTGGSSWLSSKGLPSTINLLGSSDTSSRAHYKIQGFNMGWVLPAGSFKIKCRCVNPSGEETTAETSVITVAAASGLTTNTLQASGGDHSTWSAALAWVTGAANRRLIVANGFSAAFDATGTFIDFDGNNQQIVLADPAGTRATMTVTGTAPSGSRLIQIRHGFTGVVVEGIDFVPNANTTTSDLFRIRGESSAIINCKASGDSVTPGNRWKRPFVYFRDQNQANGSIILNCEDTGTTGSGNYTVSVDGAYGGSQTATCNTVIGCSALASQNESILRSTSDMWFWNILGNTLDNSASGSKETIRMVVGKFMAATRNYCEDGGILAGLAGVSGVIDTCLIHANISLGTASSGSNISVAPGAQGCRVSCNIAGDDGIAGAGSSTSGREVEYALFLHNVVLGSDLLMPGTSDATNVTDAEAIGNLLMDQVGTPAYNMRIASAALKTGTAIDRNVFGEPLTAWSSTWNGSANDLATHNAQTGVGTDFDVDTVLDVGYGVVSGSSTVTRDTRIGDDLWGTPLGASMSAGAVETPDLAPPDTTAPTFSSASAAGTTLTINFTEAGGDIVLGTDGITGLTVGGVLGQVLLTGASASGDAITATMSRAFRTGEAPYLLYARGSNDGIQDEAGNHLANNVIVENWSITLSSGSLPEPTPEDDLPTPSTWYGMAGLTTGTNTGESPTNAFQLNTFADVENAIGIVSEAGGGTLRLMGPTGITNVTQIADCSLFASLTTADDIEFPADSANVHVVMEAGFSISMQRRINNPLLWTDETGGIFSIALSDGEPFKVFYDFSQDDADGTVTGVARTAAAKARGIALARARGGINHTASKDDVYNQWYGALTKTAGNQTAPSDGEYGWESGRLYVHPAGSDDIADIAERLTWSGRGRAAFVGNGTNNTLEGQPGHIHIIGHGDAGGNGAAGGAGNRGYFVLVQDGTGFTTKNVAGVLGGWHTFGAAAGNPLNVVFDGCIGVGMDDSSHTAAAAQAEYIPFVFFNLTRSNFDAGSVFRNCAHVHVGDALADGTPTNFDKPCKVFYTHLGETGARVRGVTVANPLLLDYSQELSNAAVGGAIYEPADEDVLDDTPATPLLARDEANWHHKCIGAVGVGQSANPGFNCYNQDFYLDRAGAGSATEPIKNVNFLDNPARMYHMGRGYWNHGLTDEAVLGHATRGLICWDGVMFESGAGTLGVINGMRGTADTAYLRNITHSGTSAGVGASIGPRFILDGGVRGGTDNPFSAGGGGNNFGPPYVVATSNASLLESNNNTVAEMITIGGLSGVFADALTWTITPGPITITGITVDGKTTTVTWSSPSSASVSVELTGAISPTNSQVSTTADTGTLDIETTNAVWFRVVDGTTDATTPWILLTEGVGGQTVVRGTQHPLGARRNRRLV